MTTHPARTAADVIYRERPMTCKVPLLYTVTDGRIAADYDPDQITVADARQLLAAAQADHPGARAVTLTDTGRTIDAPLPAGTLPVRVERDDRGCTVTYDGTRITPDQLLTLLARARGGEHQAALLQHAADTTPTDDLGALLTEAGAR